MKSRTLSVLIALAIGSTVAAQSSMTLTVGLGGDNHTADWESGTFALFTGGSQADGQSYAVGTPLTWDITVAVGGVHQTTPGGLPGDGVAPNGAALVVFNLELREGTAGGPLAAVSRATVVSDTPTTAGWYSSINDGDGGDSTENAAFTNVFNIAGNGPPSNAGRLIDLIAQGGPYLDLPQFPSVAGLPIGASTLPGKLEGMGAGFTAFTPNGVFSRTAGVGMTGSTGGGCTGLLNPPLFEGQISTIGLATGTYVLVVVPEAGNVLRGDFNCATESPASFAVAANALTGDDITFSLTAPPPAPTVTSAESLATHGGAGEQSIAMGVSPAVGDVECRSQTSPRKRKINLDSAISANDGSIDDGDEIVVTCNPPAAVTASNITLTNGGTSLEFDLTGVPERCCLSILLHDLATDLGSGVPGNTMPDTTILQRVLTGDATNSGKATSADVNLVKSLAGATTGANFRADLNADGTVDNTDTNLAKASTRGQVQACP